MNTDVYSLISEDDLNEELTEMACICGIAAVRQMIRHFHGFSFYIPKISSLNKFSEKYILSNPDKSTRELARELNVSIQYVRNLKSILKKKKPAPVKS